MISILETNQCNLARFISDKSKGLLGGTRHTSEVGEVGEVCAGLREQERIQHLYGGVSRKTPKICKTGTIRKKRRKGEPVLSKKKREKGGGCSSAGAPTKRIDSLMNGQKTKRNGGWGDGESVVKKKRAASGDTERK